MALRRMENCGAYLTTAQSAAFMLLGSAEHENFKAVSGLVKDHMVLRNEFNEQVERIHDVQVGGGVHFCLMHPFTSTRRENKEMWKVVDTRAEEPCTNLINSHAGCSSLEYNYMGEKQTQTKTATSKPSRGKRTLYF